jgi:hypothetical protein
MPGRRAGHFRIWRMDPEKHVLDPDRRWVPVFGQDHAP